MLAEIIKFSGKSSTIAAILDESTTIGMKSSPCYIVVMHTTPSFEWGMHFISQMNMAKVDGETEMSYYEKLKDVFHDELWHKILYLGTDGCHAMRSSREYAGEQGNDDGDNLLAEMRNNHENGEHITAIHCLLHLMNLAMGETMLAYELDLEVTFIPFMQSVASYFSRSAQRKQEFQTFGAGLQDMIKELQTAFGGAREAASEPEPELEAWDAMDDDLSPSAPIFGDVSEWGLLDINGCCPTRWLGMYIALLSLNNGWLVLEKMASDRDENGYGPTDRAGALEITWRTEANQHDEVTSNGKPSHTATKAQKKKCEKCAAKHKDDEGHEDPRNVLGKKTIDELLPLDPTNFPG